MNLNKLSFITIVYFSIFSIVTFIMSLSFYFLYEDIKCEMGNQLKINLDLSAQTLKNNIVSYIDSYAINEYEKLISNEIENKNYNAIILKDYNMADIISKEYYLSGKIIVNNKIVDYDEKNISHNEILKNSFYDKEFNIIKDKKVIGVVHIYISDKKLKSRLDSLFTTIILKTIIIAITFIVFFIFILIYYIFLRPLKYIIKTINKTDKNGIPEEILSKNFIKEIYILVISINNTIALIKKANKSIIESSKKTELSKLKYKALLDFASDDIFIMDIDGNLVEYSKSTQKMLGYTDSEMQNLKVYDWDKTITEKEFYKIVQKLSNNVYIFERIHTKKNNTSYNAQIYATKIYIQDKTYIYASTRDITKEQQLKKEIINEKNFVSTIVDNANAIIAVINADGIMSRINKYGQDFTGYSQEEISSEPFFWKVFLKENIRDKVVNIIYEANKGNIIKFYQNSWTSKRGEERVFEWSNTLVNKDDGTLDYIFTIGIDVTEKIKIQKELSNSEFRWKFAVDGNKDGLWDWNVQTNEVYFSEQWKIMLGFEPSEIKNDLDEWKNRVHPDDIDKVFEDIKNYFSGKTDIYLNKHRVKCKDGSYKWILDRGVIVSKDENNKPLRMIGTHTDIDNDIKKENIIKMQKNELEEKNILLQEQNRKLEESEYELSLINENLTDTVKKQVNEIRQKEQLLIQQSKLATMGEMIGNIAHQWRQPLNVLSLKKDIIIEEYFSDELNDNKVEEFEKDTNDIIQYMSKTIDDFRNFFIPSKEKVNFDLIDSLNSIVNIVNPQLINHRIKLNIVNHLKDKTNILGYPNEFKQVIINLINNSKDAIISMQNSHNIDNGTIDIEILKDKNSKIVVYISDNGGGIPEDIADKIFEPYFTTKFKSQGTGLGLYMSKTIIEINMGGKLLFENTKSGTKFIIIF